jgi:ssDNA-specific exonuclease RecJ
MTYLSRLYKSLIKFKKLNIRKNLKTFLDTLYKNIVHLFYMTIYQSCINHNFFKFILGFNYMNA